MRRNWYSPCPPVGAVRSVLDSAFASKILAQTTALTSGSVPVARTEVVACPTARPLPSTHAKRVKARVEEMSEDWEERERNTKARRANAVSMGMFFPAGTAIWFSGYPFLK